MSGITCQGCLGHGRHTCELAAPADLIGRDDRSKLFAVLENLESKRLSTEQRAFFARPCECYKKVIGMCVSCATRDRLAAGDDPEEIMRDYGEKTGRTV